VDSEETLKTLKPNMKSLAELPVRGVIVTCASASSEFDFASRFFALGSGIDEDPVTGSAHIGKIAWGKMNSPHIRRPNEAAAPGRGLRGNGSFSAERR
jgi:predicted PhzF superfamily epimerase YddE/YHI9